MTAETENILDQDLKGQPTLQCLNPASGSVLEELPVSSLEEVEEKVGIAREAAAEWRQLSVRHRAKFIRQAQKALVARMDEVVEVALSETGKTEFDGTIEMLTTLEIMRFNRKMAPRALAPDVRPLGLLVKNKRGSVHYRPHGVVGAISPWNYPLIQPSIMVVPALLAGNGIVLKPSEFTPLTALKMKEVYDDSGMPEGIFQIVIGAGEVGKTLVESSGTDLIAFTGSINVGRKIAVSCAEQLKPVILELGGKDPLIVLRDANLKRAAGAAVWSGFHNAGQTCISVERVYVEEPVADEFIQLVTEMTEAVITGDDQSVSDFGSMTTETQFGKVMAQLDDARSKGANVLSQTEPQHEGMFIQPIIVTDAEVNMELMKEEIFGPVIAISRVRDEDEAVEQANSMKFGLNGSIFSRDKRKARRLASRVQAGNIVINDVETNYLCVDVPFGGMKQSGIGRLHGIEGLRSFSQIQSVVEHRFGLNKELWWFPVANRTKKLFRALIRILYG
ncbi:MAG: aldehyde dehydrogenase family protein [Candidatus Neomarinimicrobiota bacterium]|nr:aldehyde dehydrogenase family protein [Candidatus Neomarinimicrobiota bacterium]